MSSPATGILSTPTIYGKVDYGPTFGQVYRPLNPKRVVLTSAAIVIPYDVFIIMQCGAPWTLALPDLNLWMLQPYGGFELTIKNSTLFDGVVTAFGTQQIDANGVTFTIGDSRGVGAVVFSPLPDRSGWITL